MKGNLVSLTRGVDGTRLLTISLQDDFREEFDELYGKEIEITIKKASRLRSLDANALAWTIIDRIAEKSGYKKNEVYRNAIRDIGGVSTIVCARSDAAETLCRKWQYKGLGWQAEPFESKIPGCTNATLYYGSSTYDTAQMSRLIDSLKQDAESYGIAVSENEAKRALEKWDKKVKAA